MPTANKDVSAALTLTVTAVEERGTVKLYTLQADRAVSCRAGQYISLRLHIGDWVTTRAYSLCSTPKEAENGCLRIAVERVPGGLGSNYIQDTWQVGMQVQASLPQGNFGYRPGQDPQHIIALAGGSGVTPFLSMAGAIAEDSEDFRLTILYGNPTVEEAVFTPELLRLSERCLKVQVVQVLSEEAVPGAEQGFFTADMIAKYAAGKPAAVLLCGPRPMYDAMAAVLPRLGFPPEYIRPEMYGETVDPCSLPDSLEAFPEHCLITFRKEDTEVTFPAEPGLSILRNLEKQGILHPSLCRCGVCTSCMATLLSGRVYIPAVHDHRTEQEKRESRIPLCSAWALSHVVIEQ